MLQGHTLSKLNQGLDSRFLMRADAPPFIPSNLAVNNHDVVMGPSSNKNQSNNTASKKKGANKSKARKKRTNNRNHDAADAKSSTAETNNLSTHQTDGISNKKTSKKNTGNKKTASRQNGNDTKAKPKLRKKRIQQKQSEYNDANNQREELTEPLHATLVPVQDWMEFPTLGGCGDRAEAHVSRKSNDGVRNQTVAVGGWSTIAAVKTPTPILSQEEKVLSLLLSSSTANGARLTLLKNCRETSNIESPKVSLPTLPNRTSQMINITTEEVAMTNGDTFVLDVDRHSGKDLSPSQVEEAEESLPVTSKRPVRRMELSKLRDRWWDLLQRRSAELKRQQLQQQLELESRLGQDCSGDSQPSSDGEEEYVELKNNQHIMTIKSRAAVSDSVDMDRLNTYFECCHPVHYAILNHDLEALGHLFSLPKEKVAAIHQAVPKRKVMNEDLLTWSPLQLSIILDKPVVLEKLLRLYSMQEDTIRWGLRKEVNGFSLDCLEGNEQKVKEFPTPLMLAAWLGREECTQILLSQSASFIEAIISSKDDNGNNALHYACGVACSPIRREGFEASPVILRRLLGVVVAAGGTFPSKTIGARNKQGQTPIHIACQGGRIALVEAFLASCGCGSAFSAVIKVLAVEDEQGQTPLLAAISSQSTDLVMTLLMWRSNHHRHHKGTKNRIKASQLSIASPREAPPQCPLVWSVMTTGKVDMIQLLLEFHEPGLSSIASTDEEGLYDLNTALHEAVIRSAMHQFPRDTEIDSNKEMLDIIRVLVQHGANPTVAPGKQSWGIQPTETERKAKAVDKSKESGIPNKGYSRVTTLNGAVVSQGTKEALETSPLSLAAGLGSEATLSALLDAHSYHRQRERVSRRRDSTLSNQPESFFHAIEAMEEHESNSALSDALVTSLFLAHRSETSGFLETKGQSLSEAYLLCSLALLLRGAQFEAVSLARLKCSLKASNLKRLDDVFTNSTTSAAHDLDYHYKFRTGYSRDAIYMGEAKSALTMKDRSALLQQCSWMKAMLEDPVVVSCKWMSERQEPQLEFISRETLQSDLVALVTENGAHRLVVHGTVVSQHSAKLAAAIRFAKMSSKHHTKSSSNARHEHQLLEIDLKETPTKLCLMMLQHLYHGSIVSGLSSSREQCCQELVDLLLVSEEFLAPSLARECEMRLISRDPWQYFCWSCSSATTAGSAGSSNLPCGYENRGDECVYIVEGPPALINPESVLDVVAVAQHLEGSQLPVSSKESYVLDFAICINESASGLDSKKVQATNAQQKLTSGCWKSLHSSTSLASLREVAVNYIIANFPSVLKSKAFAAQVEETVAAFPDSEDSPANTCKKDYQTDAPLILLRMCLDEIAASDFNGAWNLR